MNSAMFNLIEALPVMPGPCQLLDWNIMKKHRIVSEYFNLLFDRESQLLFIVAQFLLNNFGCFVAEEPAPLPVLPPQMKVMGGVHQMFGRPAPVEETPTQNALHSSTRGSIDVEAAVHAPAAGEVTVSSAAPPMSFLEFFRKSMTLAEDRVLSFVCVFSTGYGTAWIPGATFSYTPEVRWSGLLPQRRRWLNGTFASFIFFFMSKRAVLRTKGGTFDEHKLGKCCLFSSIMWHGSN